MSSLGKAVGIIRTTSLLLRRGPQRMIRRNGSGGVHITPLYRQYPTLTKNQKITGEVLSSGMWFWILWHFWHNPDAVLGHFPWPDPAEWTDEELGIPPDDEE